MTGEPPPGGASFAPGADRTTGRYLVLFAPDQVEDGVSALARGAGIDASRTRHLHPDEFGPEAVEATGSLALDDLGVAVVNAEPDQFQPLSDTVQASPAMLAVAPERWLYPIETPAPSAGLENTAEGTWGLHATNVLESKASGKGVRVAVLDTGCDLAHPDLAPRIAASQSFVADEPAQDAHGHGTHCCGTVAGPRSGRGETRYGVAPDVELYVGKVMGAGGGGEGTLLNGIAWALASGCRVADLSLGAPTLPDEPFNPVVEAAGQRATARGLLLVAAAGNDSDRPHGVIAPVSRPANTPSMMAVGAIDAKLAIGGFSNGAMGSAKVDIAAPGVGVYAAWPKAPGYRLSSGTSMAAPHVTGLAALWAEQTPEAPAAELWTLLARGARALDLAARDAGVGLALAP